MIKRYTAKKSFFTKNRGFTAGNDYFLSDEEAKEFIERKLLVNTNVQVKKEKAKKETTEKVDEKIMKKEVTKK